MQMILSQRAFNVFLKLRITHYWTEQSFIWVSICRLKSCPTASVCVLPSLFFHIFGPLLFVHSCISSSLSLRPFFLCFIRHTFSVLWLKQSLNIDQSGNLLAVLVSQNSSYWSSVFPDTTTEPYKDPNRNIFFQFQKTFVFRSSHGSVCSCNYVHLTNLLT